MDFMIDVIMGKDEAYWKLVLRMNFRGSIPCVTTAYYSKQIPK